MRKDFFKDLKEEKETKVDFKEKFTKAKKSTNSIALDKFEEQKDSKQVRKPVSFSIHNDLKDEIEKYCENNHISKSMFATLAFRKYLERD